MEALKVLGAAMLLAWSQVVGASTIGFDDLDASLGDISLDAISPYQGLTWANFSAYTSFPGFDGFNNGIISPANAAYSGGELAGGSISPIIGRIQSGNAFNFVSAYVGAGYYDDLSVTVQGLLGGSVVFSQVVTVGTGGAQFVSFNFTGIDELDFFAAATGQTTDPFGCGSFNCTQFTVDDLVFATATEPPPTPAPEPSTLALLGLAAVASGVARRKGAASAG